MRLLLVVHPSRDSSAVVAGRLAAEALRLGLRVAASPDDASRIEGVESWVVEPPGPQDVVVAVGGDGTVLQAAHLGLSIGAPVVGINAGTVGFLAEVDPSQIPEALDALVSGRFRESPRMTLEVEMPDGSLAVGLNDVVVEKAVSRQVVSIGVSVAGERLVEYRTDAVIVATPTGSTAYTFSAGGPLVDPEMDALILTAVAPHNLFGRAIVFDPTAELEVTVTTERAARVNIDGHTLGDLGVGEGIKVRSGPGRVRLLRLAPTNFARTVKEKFHLHDA